MQCLPTYKRVPILLRQKTHDHHPQPKAQTDNKKLIFMKGAPEIILRYCARNVKIKQQLRSHRTKAPTHP